MDNKSRIQANNAELRVCITIANSLPDADTPAVTVLQSKTVTPSKSTQEVTADEGYTALEKVTVNPIPDEYIVPSGTKAINQNGTHSVKEYDSVSVNVPIPDGYIKPSGTKTITENGTHDVTSYASVNVNVDAEEDLDTELTSIEAKIARLTEIIESAAASEGNFTINGKEYTFSIGMTWSEFVSSNYNTNGDVLVDEDDYVSVAETGYLTWYNERDDLDEEVFGSDKIINGMAYTAW